MRLTVAVAQLVESQIVILVVVGSSPISHPKKDLFYRSFFYGLFDNCETKCFGQSVGSF